MTNFSNFIKEFLRLKQKKVIFSVLVISVALLGWRLGWLNYVPELKTPIGVFSLHDQASIKEAVIKEAVVDSSNILPSSIYSILYDIYYMQGTFFERKNLFEKYKGFQIKDEGKFVDRGEDGKTIVIKGSNNGKNASFLCIFQDKWEQRLGIMNIGDDIIFKGIISALNSPYLVILTDCEIPE